MTMEKEEESYLPEDVWRIVLSNIICPDDLAQLSLVCKTWYRICKQVPRVLSASGYRLQEQWLFGCGEDKLMAINADHHYVEEIPLPWRSLAVLATQKNLGLVCLQTNDKVMYLGNPLTAKWDEITLKDVEGYILGALLTWKQPTLAYQLRVLVASIHKVRVYVFDSDSGHWACEADHILPGKYVNPAQLIYTTNGSKFYVAYKQGNNLSVDTYDTNNGAWEAVVKDMPFSAVHSRVNWASDYSHKCVTSIVVCDSKLYMVRNIVHDTLIKIWLLDSRSNTLKYISGFYYDFVPVLTTFCHYEFASDGKSRIFAVCKDFFLEYDLIGKRWLSSRINLHSRSISCVCPGYMSFPFKVTNREMTDDRGSTSVTHLQSDSMKTWLCITRRKLRSKALLEPISFFCPEENSWLSTPTTLREVPGQVFTKYTSHFQTSERDLGLVCFPTRECLQESPPVLLVVVNISKGSWRMVSLHADQLGLNPENDSSIEFAGLTMKKRPGGPGYLIYYFYRKNANLYVWLYDSATELWKEVGTPLKIDPKSHGWHCTGTGSRSKFKSKIYLCSISFHQRRFGRVPHRQSQAQLWHGGNFSTVRMVAFNTQSNVWEEDILPEEGVDIDGLKKIRSTMLLCNDQFYMVGTGRGPEIVHVWKMEAGGCFEEVSRIKAGLALEGTIRYATDGVGKIFVIVCESKCSTEHSRVIEYDLEKQLWTCIPLAESNNIWGVIAL